MIALSIATPAPYRKLLPASLRRVAGNLSTLLLCVSLLATPAAAQAPLPRIVSEQGRHALLVDGAPFLMLGAQVHNSSNYPAMLPKVWPVIHRLGANTVEVPIAWEQVEPAEGRFDLSFVDELVRQARANDVRLVLLWFATWKNTGASYTPEWVKSDTRRFPRMITRDGKTHYVLSPHGRTTLEADTKAFVRLMQHLRAIDPQHTVIMVQVQNESGSYRSPRDFSPKAQRLFDGPIPADLAARDRQARHVGAGLWQAGRPGIQRLARRPLYRRDRRRRPGGSRPADVRQRRAQRPVQGRRRAQWR